MRVRREHPEGVREGVCSMARILHVDDEPSWIDLVRKALADHHVDSARSYEDALRLLISQAPYDLALVDFNLIDEGDRMGGEILALLKRRYPSTHRVVVTGTPPGGSVSANFDRYAVEAIIIKGKLSLPDLRTVVEDALDRRDDDVEQDVRLQVSELRQRLREMQRNDGSLIGDRVRDAEEYVGNARHLHERSARRAQDRLKEMQALAAFFSSECARMAPLLDSVRSRHEATSAAEELDRLETRIAEQLRDDRPVPEDDGR
jgi:response regulator RpfG family c-di-GMP phosphodiesterase